MCDVQRQVVERPSQTAGAAAAASSHRSAATPSAPACAGRFARSAARAAM